MHLANSKEMHIFATDDEPYLQLVAQHHGFFECIS